MVMSPTQTQEEVDMSKLAMLAVAVAVVVAPAVVAEESTVPLGQGEAIMIRPDGTVQKSNDKGSAAQHEAAIAHGAV